MGRMFAELGLKTEKIAGIELQEKIGFGGSSVVLRGITPDETEVAIKIATPKGREKVAKEGEVLESFDPHPNIVHLQSQGKRRIRQGLMIKTLPYLVLDYVPGTIHGLLESQPDKRLQPEKALEIVEQTAKGLAIVHNNKLVHGDIKPENLLYDNNHVRIADFGTAVEIKSEWQRPSDKLEGTAPYIAPELFSQRYPRPASDVYSLGITTYKLLMGRPPYYYEQRKGHSTHNKTGAMDLTYLYKEAHQMETPTSFERILGPDMTDVHGAMEKVILEKALTKEPGDRASALEFAADLRETYEKTHH